jgi:site-specific DNA-adenine methylase
MLGIPYMGSKRKIAGKLVDYMLNNTPNAKYVYDLFGGGGAISFEFMQRPQIERVVYNELNTGVVELLRKIQKDGVTPEFYEWVTREEFKELKGGNDWRAGLVKTCWSFGNNQRSYIYGQQIERDKELLHRIVVDKCWDSFEEFNFNHVGVIGREVFQIKSMHERRLFVLGEIKISGKRIDLEQIEHIQRIQHLERLEQLQLLETSNLSALDVIIDTPTHETIVYLDPPYFGTEEYAEKMCHDELYRFVDELTERGYKVYLSSYDSHMHEVFQVAHRSTLNAKVNNKVAERLFCNVAESDASKLF